MQKINKKHIIAGSVILAVIIAVVLMLTLGGKAPAPEKSVAAQNGNITEKISLTGDVKASQGVDLAFEISGKIVANDVASGDKVYAGQTIAVINQASALDALTSAKGLLAQAQANYEKLNDGATAETIQTAQDGVNSAKQNVTSAYDEALTTLNTAYTSMYSAYSEVSVIHDSYFQSQDMEGAAVSAARDDINTNMQTIKTSLSASENSMTPSDIDSTISQTIVALNNVYDDLNIIRSQCDQGIYYYKVTATDKSALDGQKTSVNIALTGTTALQQGIASANLAFQSAQDQLKVTTAPPTQAEIDLAKAQILSAQGQVDSAETAVSNTVLSAPFSGQVDKDDAVVGQIVSPNVPIATISNNNLQIDTDIPEIDMAGIKIGDGANVTLDAFGNSVIFPATVISIDSATTEVNNIPAYGAKLKFNTADTRITPGMTANITVISETHTNVITVPITAVIQQSGKYFVMVDKGNAKTEQREVTVGLKDDKNIEITSGLASGEKVFAY